MTKKLTLIILFMCWGLTAHAGPPTIINSSTGVSTASDCNVAAYQAVGKLCQDTDDGKLYKGTGAAVEEVIGSTGNAATATALAADPAACAAGSLCTDTGADGACVCTAYTLASPGAAGAIVYSDGTNWTRATTFQAQIGDAAAQIVGSTAGHLGEWWVDLSAATTGAEVKHIHAQTADRTVTWPDGNVTFVAGTMVPATSGTLTTPIINGATGTGGKFTGDLTGLMPSVIVLVPSGVHDGGDNQAIMTDGGIDIGASALIGMTVYNVTDGSSCTITANAATTITCTLAGGTDNNWDDSDVWQVGPGPSQSGSVFYVAGAGTIRHPATAGYGGCYVADGANKLTVDMASDTMVFTGTLDAAVATLDAGDSIDSSDTTTDDYMCLHNKSATAVKGLGKRGTWADGGAS